jgi:hypothetical protein
MSIQITPDACVGDELSVYFIRSAGISRKRLDLRALEAGPRRCAAAAITTRDEN